MPLSSFIGRAAELDEVAALLDGHRLVVMVGAGGCGKSRLALEVVRRRLLGTFESVWWIDLASVPIGAVEAALAEGVGVSPGPGGDALQSVVDRLGGARTGRTLVVLDNAEHLLQEVVAVTRTMLSASETVAVLVTSREPMRMSGELLWWVPSLPVPPLDAHRRQILEAFDACRLFIERLESQRMPKRWSSGDYRAVASICTRLDGIPFALELAAARARSMSLRQVLDGLDDCLQLLTLGDRDALPRHQTLRASLAWSLSLLTPHERRLLACLSVFVGAFTAEAAGGVADPDASSMVVDALSSLVDKSLVQCETGTGRYRLLETTRQCAAAELDASGDAALVRRRHASWWARWSTEVGKGQHGSVAADLHWAMSNFEVAAGWADRHDREAYFTMQRGLGWFWDGVGRWERLAAAYESVLATPAEAKGRAWAGAVAGLAWAGVPLGRTEALELHPQTTRLLADDAAGVRLAAFAPAVVAAFQGDLAPLRLLAGEVLDAADEPAVPLVLGTLLAYAGTAGYFEEADDAYQRLLEHLARGDQPFTSDSARSGHYGAINLRREQGRFFEAEQLSLATDEPRDATTALTTAAAAVTLAVTAGRPALADVALRWLKRHVPPGIADLRSYTLAMAARLAGDHRAAADHIAATLNPGTGLLHIVAGRQAQRRVSYRHRYTVCLLLGGGRLDDARRLTAVTPDAGSSPLPRASDSYGRSLVLAAGGHVDAALEEAMSALRLAVDHRFVVLRVDALEQVGRMRWQQGKRTMAARLLAAARSERNRLGYADRLVPDPRRDREWVDLVAARERVAFDEGGNTSMATAAAVALRQRGRRDRPATGIESLTPTEHEVARLAREGLTNGAIASRLLMSPATVKTHLSRIFTKLNAPNRTALAATYPSDR